MEDQQSLAQIPRRDFLFVVNGEASVEPSNPDFFNHGESSGKRRPHYKSRRGCLICKQRRVKCNEQFPCSNCRKRHERCIQLNTAEARRRNAPSTGIPETPNTVVVDNTSINLLHLELFYHFQRDLVGTLAFSEIWQHVLPWSFQEPYIMCSILCLAATHLSTLRPQACRYSKVAAQLLSKSALSFSEGLSGPVTAQNSEALIATSILMHYISWSHIEFAEKQETTSSASGNSPLSVRLSNDPLLQLSFGVQGILCEAFRILAGSDSVFLATGLYSPIYTLEEAISKTGENPWRFVDHFIRISNDLNHEQSVYSHCDEVCKQWPLDCPLPHTNGHDAQTVPPPPPQHTHSQQAAFESVSKRLSLLFCLVSISASGSHSASETLIHLQPDIERCLFSFPVHYSSIFREPVLRGGSGALIMLCHFYRAARILLTSAGTWWAQQRSRVIERLILGDLASRGLDAYVLGEGL
ncbi:hypothetical protein GGR58DRAFT_516093 [Xylaria digitata]|nr:hypothetical protein GGR58DRAFT_516093 [Xylaria digitata]